MVNIFEIYEYVLFKANKEQSGNTFTPDKFNLTCKIVNLEYFKLKVGLPEAYVPGKPFPPQAYQISQKMTDDIMPFIKWLGGPDYPILSLDQYGVGIIPPDYVAYSSCYYDYVAKGANCDTEETITPREVEFITDANWSDRVSSKIDYPDKKYPCAKWIGNNKIQFLPRDLKSVNFTYLREPIAPVLGYTYDGNNDIVYNPTTSTQFEWPQVCLSDIANMIYSIMAGNLKSQIDIQLANQRKAGGTE
jgi:hypothetical protein